MCEQDNHIVNRRICLLTGALSKYEDLTSGAARIAVSIHIFLTELLGDILKEQPQEADGIDSVVLVDNVPQVGPERLEKLKNVIHKIFSKFGKITTEFYPEADGLTKGYFWNSLSSVIFTTLIIYLW